MYLPGILDISVMFSALQFPFSIKAAPSSDKLPPLALLSSFLGDVAIEGACVSEERKQGMGTHGALISHSDTLLTFGKRSPTLCSHAYHPVPGATRF